MRTYSRTQMNDMIVNAYNNIYMKSTIEQRNYLMSNHDLLKSIADEYSYNNNLPSSFFNDIGKQVGCTGELIRSVLRKYFNIDSIYDIKRKVKFSTGSNYIPFVTKQKNNKRFGINELQKNIEDLKCLRMAFDDYVDGKYLSFKDACRQYPTLSKYGHNALNRILFESYGIPLSNSINGYIKLKDIAEHPNYLNSRKTNSDIESIDVPPFTKKLRAKVLRKNVKDLKYLKMAFDDYVDGKYSNFQESCDQYPTLSKYNPSTLIYILSELYDIRNASSDTKYVKLENIVKHPNYLNSRVNYNIIVTPPYISHPDDNVDDINITDEIKKPKIWYITCKTIDIYEDTYYIFDNSENADIKIGDVIHHIKTINQNKNCVHSNRKLIDSKLESIIGSECNTSIKNNTEQILL